MCTQQRRLRSGETPLRSPGSRRRKKTIFCSNAEKTRAENRPTAEITTLRLTYSVGGDLCTVRSRFSSGSSLRGCPAAVAGSSVCRGKRGVGRSFGYAPTCVCSVSQCRRWQLDGAHRYRPAARRARKDDLGERLSEQQRHPHLLFLCLVYFCLHDICHSRERDFYSFI